MFNGFGQRYSRPHKDSYSRVFQHKHTEEYISVEYQNNIFDLCFLAAVAWFQCVQEGVKPTPAMKAICNRKSKV